MEDEFQTGSPVPLHPSPPLTPTTIQKAVSKPEETNDEASSNKVHIYNTGPNLSVTAVS